MTNPSVSPNALGNSRHLHRTAFLSVLLPFLMIAHDVVADVLGLNLEHILLTFGCVVLAGWLYSWRAIFYFTPGLIALSCLAWSDFEHVSGELVLNACLAVGMAPFAFLTMRWAGIDTTVDLSGGRRVWRIIILAGVKTSVFSLVLKGALLQFIGVLVVSVDVAYLVLIADILGLTLFMMATMLVVGRPPRSGNAV